MKPRLRAAGDLPGATVDQQIALLEQLATFDLGRFLLENRGLNAYWTHQLITSPPGTRTARDPDDLEYRIFETMPLINASRERFDIFRQQLQKLLSPGSIIASIPCGLMAELLLLDYDGLDDVTLIGIDLDRAALDAALALAGERGLADRLSVRRADAWATGLNAEVDALVSNGLNMYEPDDDRLTALYRSFFDSLKPGGTLITSIITPPPSVSADSPWRMDEIDTDSLALQDVLFTRLIEVKWNNFRTYARTRNQLEQAGFSDIEFIDNRTRIFPTVIAHKPR
ncbi:SAM-dependent methyltransferase [Nocardia sp. 004]|uniref:SAM-dependent methyltransferase n=1 Tax=Nocardia sp. 004 TaxID=3385978 RepID=UPI0039A335A3